MAMFPMFFLFGMLTHRKEIDIAIAIASAAAMFYFTILFALGWWAF
jgi:hypothetical protein